MYVIEPVIGRIHLNWKDSFDIVQHVLADVTAGAVDVQRFPGLTSSNEVVLILPTGLDIINEVKNRLDSHVLKLLSECARRLPEYNQIAYEIASQLVDKYPNLPVRLICNSAFFTDLPIRERSYALDPLRFTSSYQRFGGDGLCHFGAVKSIQTQIPGEQRVISIHLCSQPSITAWQNDMPVYTSMGYSPLEGLISADGCGSIDPGIPLMLADSGYSPAEIRRLLVQNSGWNTLPVQMIVSDDLVSMESSGNSLSMDIMLEQVVEHIGCACSALGGVDTIVFSVESPEQSQSLISRVTSKLEWLGFKSATQPVMVDDFLLLSGENSSIRVLAKEYSPVRIISSFL